MEQEIIRSCIQQEKQGKIMYIEYQYFFNNEKKFPSFITDFIDEIPGERYFIRISPNSDDKVWRKNSLKFLKFLNSPKADSIKPWHTRVVYGAQEDNFKYKEYNESEILALDMTNILGYDKNANEQDLCKICGRKSLENKEIIIDEKTVLYWQIGFSQTNRLIFHVNSFEKILLSNLTGYKANAVKCVYPNDYIIKLWCGNINKNRTLLNEYNGKFPDGINIEEWIDFTVMIVPEKVYNKNEFIEFDKYLSYLADKDVLDYDLIPPARKAGQLPICRWVELEIIGNAGIESSLNDYDQNVKCPSCGIGGALPTSKLTIDYSYWDNTDFCITDLGRICVSKKAYKLLNDEWGVLAEPLKDVSE